MYISISEPITKNNIKETNLMKQYNINSIHSKQKPRNNIKIQNTIPKHKNKASVCRLTLQNKQEDIAINDKPKKIQNPKFSSFAQEQNKLPIYVGTQNCEKHKNHFTVNHKNKKEQHTDLNISNNTNKHNSQKQ